MKIVSASKLAKERHEHFAKIGRKGGKIGGAKGGASRSKLKARAARTNGRKGGRPGNPEIARIREELGCTREWARQIYLKQKRRK